MRKVVGLDKTAVCVVDIDGTLVWRGRVDSEPGLLIDKLRAWQTEIDVVVSTPPVIWFFRAFGAGGGRRVGRLAYGSCRGEYAVAQELEVGAAVHLTPWMNTA